MWSLRVKPEANHGLIGQSNHHIPPALPVAAWARAIVLVYTIGAHMISY